MFHFSQPFCILCCGIKMGPFMSCNIWDAAVDQFVTSIRKNCQQQLNSSLWFVAVKGPLLQIFRCVQTIWMCCNIHEISKLTVFPCVNLHLCSEAGRCHPAPRGHQIAATFRWRTDQTTPPVTVLQNFLLLRIGDYYLNSLYNSVLFYICTLRR